MPNTIIYTGYSDDNKELAMLTLPNKEQYAKRHGYELVVDKIEWQEFILQGLIRIMELLNEADTVFCVASDVLLMNHYLTVESLIQDERAIISKEAISYWPINNDVLLVRNNDTCRKLLQRIINDYELWRYNSWLWQAHLWDLIQKEPEIAASVRLAEPRELQSTHQLGLGKWQLGDRTIHFLNHRYEVKIALAKLYLPFAGEPTFNTCANVPKFAQDFVADSFRFDRATITKGRKQNDNKINA